MVTDHILEHIELLVLPTQSNVYRLFEYTNEPHSIFYGIDSDAHLVFIVPSLHPMMRHQRQYTRKLVLDSNLKCEMLINEVSSEMTVHALTCLSTVRDERIAFLRLTEAFSQHLSADQPYIMNELFSALENLFAQDGTSSEKELQGLYAELYVIYYFLKHGVNLCEYWQKQDKLNFDFSISTSKRIEVKSTTRSERIHHFKHEQLLSDLYDIIVASVLLRKDDAGLSLLSLIEDIRAVIAQDFRTLLYIDRFIKNIPEEDLRELRYDETYSAKHIRFFPAANIPKFDEVQPDGVSHAEYDSDLTSAIYLTSDEMLSWLSLAGGE